MQMARSNNFQVRLTDEEYAMLKAYAQAKQLTSAEVVRQYVWTLPRLVD